jgi:ribonuclease G
MDILIEEYEGSLWAAAIDKGRLRGIELDPAREQVRWGNIYLAKVKTIDAGLDAAFLDLGDGNTGILYNTDIRTRLKDGRIQKGGEKSIGKTLKPGQMLAVQAKTAYLPKSDSREDTRENKIPQMSMDITIQGRYMVGAPIAGQGNISRRITDLKLRGKIKKTLSQITGDINFIVRAAAADTQTEILSREARILQATWKDISSHLNGSTPALIMLGPDALQRILSDMTGSHIDHIQVVTMAHLNHAEDWCNLFAPELTAKIEPLELKNATQDLALFQHYDVLAMIRNLLKPYVVLPGGGNVLIQPTAALTAIDVNKGADKRPPLSVNLEAAEEIASQARLRNLGGIIMIDFIRMQGAADKKSVLNALEKAFSADPCTVQIHGTTNLGLIEVTRKRRTPALTERMESIDI